MVELAARAEAIQAAHGEVSDIADVAGTITTKIKALVGFGQCMIFFPTVFSVPWPKQFLSLVSYMQFMAFDFSSFFGLFSCQMYTNYGTKLKFYILAGPGILLCIIFAVIFASSFNNILSKRKIYLMYTNESLQTRTYTLVQTITFTAYSSISTTIFKLFECEKIQDIDYLRVDMSVRCFEEEWWGYFCWAITGIVLYVLGIPLMQFYALFKNRRNLHYEVAEDKKVQRQIAKMYGPTYLHYNEHCYYFDLLDMFRRLMLTGILVLVGGKDVSQLFIGILISVFWVAVLAYNRPYGDYWDNFITIMLSVHLAVTLISGMALKLFDMMESNKDQSEKNALGLILVIISWLSFLLSTLAIVMSTSFVRDRLDKWVENDEEEDEKNDANGIKKERVEEIVKIEHGKPGKPTVKYVYIQRPRWFQSIMSN